MTWRRLMAICCVLPQLIGACRLVKMDATPQRTLAAYLKAQNIGDVEVSYFLLCGGEKSQKSYAQYVSDQTKDHGLRPDFASHVHYETRWLKMDDKFAMANVDSTMPQTLTLSGKKTTRAQTLTTMLVLLKEHDGWRIYTGALSGAAPGPDLGLQPAGTAPQPAPRGHGR